jgi:hypothetical protein
MDCIKSGVDKIWTASTRLEVELPAQRDGGLGGTVGALERPVVALGKLLNGLLAQHMAARKEHWRILRSALVS